MNGGNKVYSPEEKRNPKAGLREYYADAGRFGDDRMGVVDGEPAHINAWEEYLLDTHGEIGEEIVKIIGSGTTNPKTGMDEYHYKGWSPLNEHNRNHALEATGLDNTFVGDLLDGSAGLVNGIIEGVGAGLGFDEDGNWTPNDGAGAYFDNLWNNILGNEGLGGMVDDLSIWVGGGNGTNWFSNQKSQSYLDEKSTLASINTITGSTIGSLQSDLERSIGPEGSIAESAKLDRQLLGAKTGDAYTQTVGKSNQIKSQSGFATMGGGATGVKPFDFTESKIGLQKSYMNESTEKADLVSNIQKELNQIVMGYQEATGDPYKSSGLDALQAQLDELT